MLPVGAIHFEDRFCASKKGGIGGGGRVSARGAVHMAATLAGQELFVKIYTEHIKHRHSERRLPRREILA